MTNEQKNKITLTNEYQESISRGNDDLSISPKGKFTVAVAVFGNWIIFNTEDDSPKNYLSKTLDAEEKPRGKLPGGKPITAVKTINYVEDGICLCEHKNFYGKNYTYATTSATEEQFPSAQGTKGVSSFIIFGDAKWKLYYEDVNGDTKKTEVCGECRDVADLGIVDGAIFKVAKL